MPITTFTIECVSIEVIGPQVKHFKFKLTDNKKFDYLPGQFITLHLEDEGREIKRSYSIASHPSESDAIEFAASFVEHGFASTLLFDLEIDSRLICSGPYGRLILPEVDPKHYIFIATGTGVTPYKAMLPDLAARLTATDTMKVTVLFGCRTTADALYESTFLDFMNTHPRFNYSVHLSREKSPLAPHQKYGYVQHQLNQMILSPETDLVYLCGNPNMIDEAFAQLKDRGFAASNVKREKYISK